MRLLLSTLCALPLVVSSQECTDGSATKDVIGYTMDGERVTNTKLEAVRWRRFEHLLAERGMLVGGHRRLRAPSWATCGA